MTKYTYRAFGQTIASDFELTSLPVESFAGAADITIIRTSGLTLESHSENPFFEITPEVQYFHWDDLGSFCIRDESTIHADPEPGTSDHLLSQPLLGIVISVMLERRGLFCLHGGAVNIDGSAAIVLGDKGAGKSTTVSSLLDAGFGLLTDDLVAIDGDIPTQPVVQSGFPSVKLWPDSAEATNVLQDADSKEIHPSLNKRQCQLNTDVMAPAVQTGAIFVLVRSDSAATKAERLSSQNALQALLYFAFIARFGNTRLGKEHLAKFMQRCCRVVATTPVYQLTIHNDLAALDTLAETIAKETRTASKTSAALA